MSARRATSRLDSTIPVRGFEPLEAPGGPGLHGGVTNAEHPARDDVDAWIARGREAMSARRYTEARDWFDKALGAVPGDPRVQSFAVTAEFWRRLAREGDGFAPATPPLPRLRGASR
jgi:hypothetical protein